MPIDEQETERLADMLIAASGRRTPVDPITDARANFDLADAYRVSRAITRKRMARGDRPIGWKIGFTNASIWATYGIHAPIWAPMYDVTVAAALVPGTIRCSLAGLLEPRIEPEIGFRLARVPDPGMDEAALLGCIDGVTHGFEIVQSVYPGWRTKAARCGRRVWNARRLSAWPVRAGSPCRARRLAPHAAGIHRRSLPRWGGG